MKSNNTARECRTKMEHKAQLSTVSVLFVEFHAEVLFFLFFSPLFDGGWYDIVAAKILPGFHGIEISAIKKYDITDKTFWHFGCGKSH